MAGTRKSAEPGSTKASIRLKRIAGQVAGVQKMVEEGRYCVDILNQIAAIRSALDAAGVELLTAHIESCMLGKGSCTSHPKSRPLSNDQLLLELRTVLARFLR